MVSLDNEVAQLETQLQKARADKAAWKAAEERQIAAEAKRVSEEKVAAEWR